MNKVLIVGSQNSIEKQKTLNDFNDPSKYFIAYIEKRRALIKEVKNQNKDLDKLADIIHFIEK